MCEGLPRAPGSSRVHFKAAPEYVRWFRWKLIQFWDALWLTSPEAVKLPFCLRFPQNFPRLERFFHAFRLRFSCCWDPFLAFRSDSEAAELEHLIQRGQKTSCGSTQSFDMIWCHSFAGKPQSKGVLQSPSGLQAAQAAMHWGCGYWAERGAAKMQQLVARQLQISRRRGWRIHWT